MADKNKRPVEAWFRSQVATGIQRLVSIGLPGGPGYDSIKLTAQAWVDTMWKAPVDWHEQLDAERLEEAFVRAGRLERWPSPRQVLDLMPSRTPPRNGLPKQRLSPEQCRANQQRIKELIREVLES